MSEANNAAIIEIPDYAANILNRAYAHTDTQKVATKRSIQRAYRLIAHALQDMPAPRNSWAIAGTKYGNSRDEDLGYEEDGVRAYIYGQERGTKWLEAVFSSTSSGADYFVWRVSQGTRKIDWDLYLDMLEEPSFLDKLFGKQ
ncbi:MAG: hypothetical protein V4614_17565 [Pseudomonadota bacterium]